MQVLVQVLVMSVHVLVRLSVGLLVQVSGPLGTWLAWLLVLVLDLVSA
jgi:hypothetical protein